MKLTDDEKRRVIDELEEIEPAKRNTLLSNLTNFTKWLASALYDIYQKVKSWISDIWEWIKFNIFNG